MKKHWKLIVSTLLLALVFALTACGGGSDNNNNNDPVPVQPGDPTDAPTEELPPERDLGGREINIAVWWGGDDSTATADPQTMGQRARWDDRAAAEDRYNFTMRYVHWGGWADVRDMLATELLAGNREIQIWTMEGGWFGAHHAQNMFAPIPLEHFDDPYGVTWNRSVLDNTMRDGMPHGFSAASGMAGGVYFNMRLFEEAGLPRDLPFQLQAEGNWTWETFTDTARQLSQDFDQDGVPDVWAITSFNQIFLAQALASNGAVYARVDPDTGLFVNATTDIAFVETIQWVMELRQEMLTLHEEDVDGGWDVYRTMFLNGDGAMMAGAEYIAGSSVQPNLADDWGFVHFPVGPRMDRPNMWVPSNVMSIPHFYTQDDVSDFMFAYTKWVRPLEDDDPYDWMFEQLANHSDERSVEITMLEYTNNPIYHEFPAHFWMAGHADTLSPLFAWRIWSPAGYDPSYIVESSQLIWDAFLDRVNDR